MKNSYKVGQRFTKNGKTMQIVSIKKNGTAAYSQVNIRTGKLVKGLKGTLPSINGEKTRLAKSWKSEKDILDAVPTINIKTLKHRRTNGFKEQTIRIFKKRKERQAHGFDNEDKIKETYDLLDYGGKTNGYTAKYDAETKNGMPVSIKTEKIKI